VFNTYYVDGDADGFGLRGSTGILACSRIVGTATNDLDCNDADEAIFPDAQEVCDPANSDEDCDGSADDGDSSVADVGKSNFYADFDNDTFTYGNAMRFCDQPIGYLDAPSSLRDCDDTNPSVSPIGLELCANLDIDNDCDGSTSEEEASDRTPFFLDADSDNYSGSFVVMACIQPAGCKSTYDADCNDGNTSIHPGAVEVCDTAIDEDCDGEVDEGCVPLAVTLTTAVAGSNEGDLIVVRIACSQPGSELSGAQFAMHFDAARLRLEAVEPVESSPLQLEVAELIDNTAGTLRYALGSLFFDGLVSAADLCDLTFRILPGADMCGAVDLVTFGDVGPFTTRFTRLADASVVAPVLNDLPPFNVDTTPPVLTGLPAANITVAADAGSTYGALVLLPPVTAVDACDGVVSVLVTGATADGRYPIGTTTVTWSAVDSAGNTTAMSRDIVVGDYQILDAVVSLANVQRGASSHAFRIKVGSTVQVVDAVMPPWTGSVPSIAVLSGIRVAVSSGHECATAKSIAVSAGGTVQRWSHAITSAAPVTVVGTHYRASFSLLSGDSDDNDLIDIIDYGNFVVDRSVPGSVSRSPEARSNYNGDSFIINDDFVALSAFMFRVGESCTPPLDAQQPRTRITVKELRRSGRSDLAAADLNHDGWVDTRDIQVYMQSGGGANGGLDAPTGEPARRW